MTSFSFIACITCISNAWLQLKWLVGWHFQQIGFLTIKGLRQLHLATMVSPNVFHGETPTPPPIFHGEHLVTLAVEPGIQGGIARSTDGDFGIQAIAQKEQTIRAGVALFLPWWWPSFCLKKVKLWLNNEQLRLIFLGKCRNSNMKRQGRNSNFPPQHFCVTDLPPSFAPASSISTSWSNANSKGDKNSPWSKR